MAKRVSHHQPPAGRVSRARAAASAILLRVETEGGYATDLLHSELTGRLDTRDAALCTELVMGCLRWQGQLDFAVRRFSRVTRLDPEVRVALRLGAYQILHLTKIPPRAAITESVELVKLARKSSAAGLVNAVLRKITESGGIHQLRTPELSAEEWQAVELAHPEWLLQRWTARFGPARAASLAGSNNQPPATYLRPVGAIESGALIRSLQDDGVNVEPASLLRNCLIVVSGDATKSGAYARREVAIQDQASQMVPLLLDARAGQQVLDLCSAPGNKSALLAEAVGTGGMVVACDAHLHRLRNWAAPAAPDAASIRRVALDASRPLPLRAGFDRVLVDAPCSGTGTLRRNPEIKWRLRPEHLRELAQLQLKLLQQGATVVVEGGRIVYSTCSLEAEENQAVVEAFLNVERSFRLVPLQEESARLANWFADPARDQVRELLDAEFLETSPEKHNTDGFFGAILQRVG